MTLDQYKLLALIDLDLMDDSSPDGAMVVRDIERIHAHFDRLLQDQFDYHGTLSTDCKSLTRDGVLSVLLEAATP